MRRWVFRIVSALSLALCVATCVLWVKGRKTGTLIGVEKTAKINDKPASALIPPTVAWQSCFLTADWRGVSWTAAHKEVFDPADPQGWHVIYDWYDGYPNSAIPVIAFHGFEYRNGKSFL